MAKRHAGHQDRRPDFDHPAEADEGPDQPERHQHREERQLPSDHAAQRQQIESGHRGEHHDRRTQRAIRHRRGIGDQREARGGERLEAQAHHDRRGDGDRRAETGGAFEERAEAERHQQQLQPAIVRDPGDALLQHVEEPGVGRQLIHEDDIEHDPADRQQPEQRAQQRRLAGHLRGHADRRRSTTASATKSPRIAAQCALTWKNARPPSSTTIGSAANERGKDRVAERIVDL